MDEKKELQQEQLEKVSGGAIPTEVGYYGKYSIYRTTGCSGGYDGPYATLTEAEIGVPDFIVNTKFLEYIDATYATYCIMQRKEGCSLVKVTTQLRIDK